MKKAIEIINEEFEHEINFTCMDCGKECNVCEEVNIGGGELNIWCYCKECGVETFHPIKYKTN